MRRKNPSSGWTASTSRWSPCWMRDFAQHANQKEQEVTRPKDTSRALYGANMLPIDDAPRIAEFSADALSLRRKRAQHWSG